MLKRVVSDNPNKKLKRLCRTQVLGGLLVIAANLEPRVKKENRFENLCTFVLLKIVEIELIAVVHFARYFYLDLVCIKLLLTRALRLDVCFLWYGPIYRSNLLILRFCALFFLLPALILFNSV